MRQPADLIRYLDRSIPACAGEPGHSKCRVHPYPVYPRVCGGTPFGMPSFHMVSGLSPRVRGNHVSYL